ncbi:MAG: GIY-YIG nuclease family protein [Candidatus Acidiferrales bacterium]
MAWLHILQSQSTGRYYVGSTNDLDRRLSEHNRAHSLATRGRGPWILVHRETFPTPIEACRRELEIKKWKWSKAIGSLIEKRFG